MAKVLMITGASRGIGAAIARRAAQDGWDVCVNYLGNAKAAAQVVDAVKAAGQRAVAIQADVADEAQTVALFERCAAELGPLGGCVVNAGTVGPATTVAEMTAERITRMLAVNLTSAFLTARETVRRLSTDSGGPGGPIVLISSAAARLGAANMYVDYAAAKGGVDTMTTGLANEVAGQGIRVNAIRPGIIETEIHAISGDADRPAKAGPSVPMGRAGTADEVANAACWLLSDEASYMTGAILDVTGGR